MSETQRCEPPEGLRDRDGLHWLRHRDGREEYARWIPDTLDSGDGGFWWRQRCDVPPTLMAQWGYRWVCAVPTPAEIAALVQRAADLERYVALNAMDRLVEEGPKIIGWEKTPDLMQKLEALRTALAAFPAKETT